MRKFSNRANRRTVLLGVTASIAAYRACEIINSLKRNNIDVVVCMSKDAAQFIGPLTLQTLSGNMVYCDMFKSVSQYDPTHINLAQKCDAILVAPATADCIAKMAAGLCDDLLTAAIISTPAPILLAPAMNEHMYKNKITQANISKLKQAGVKFIGPKKGHLACGGVGIGHIEDTEKIVRETMGALR